MPLILLSDELAGSPCCVMDCFNKWDAAALQRICYRRNIDGFKEVKVLSAIHQFYSCVFFSHQFQMKQLATGANAGVAVEILIPELQR